jgi:hypothetical protein
LLLFAAVILMIVGTSSAQRQKGVRADASPPEEIIVIDSIGDLHTDTRFKQPRSWGAPLDAHNSVGPEFTLTKTTTITEIEAYIESCAGMVGGQYLEPCEPVPSITVDIHPKLRDKPDLTTVIASYNLLNDNDRTLTSYESVKIELILEPGATTPYSTIRTNTASSWPGRAIPTSTSASQSQWPMFAGTPMRRSRPSNTSQCGFSRSLNRGALGRCRACDSAIRQLFFNEP